MPVLEKHLALVEERIEEARPLIVEQYERTRHGRENDEAQLSALVLVNMLLTFNFMRDQLIAGPHRI